MGPAGLQSYAFKYHMTYAQLMRAAGFGWRTISRANRPLFAKSNTEQQLHLTMVLSQYLDSALKTSIVGYETLDQKPWTTVWKYLNGDEYIGNWNIYLDWDSEVERFWLIPGLRQVIETELSRILKVTVPKLLDNIARATHQLQVAEDNEIPRKLYSDVVSQSRKPQEVLLHDLINDFDQIQSLELFSSALKVIEKVKGRLETLEDLPRFYDVDIQGRWIRGYLFPVLVQSLKDLSVISIPTITYEQRDNTPEGIVPWKVKFYKEFSTFSRKVISKVIHKSTSDITRDILVPQYNLLGSKRHSQKW